MIKINYDPILGCTGWEFPKLVRVKKKSLFNDPNKWKDVCQGHLEYQEQEKRNREHPGTTTIKPFEKRLKKNENN